MERKQFFANYDIEKFEYDLSNGLSLNEIISFIGSEKFKSIMVEYVNMFYEEDCNEELMFCDDEDVEVLKKYGYDMLFV